MNSVTSNFDTSNSNHGGGGEGEGGVGRVGWSYHMESASLPSQRNHHTCESGFLARNSSGGFCNY